MITIVLSYKLHIYSFRYAKQFFPFNNVENIFLYNTQNEN